MIETMRVVKRDGKKVEFDGTKIALAIKKGFDSVNWEENDKPRYTAIDINKVYNAIIHQIEEIDKDRIKIEEIQDMIEGELKKQGYHDVYESFSEYRERRAQSRKIFFDEKKQHKFLKALEDLSLKTVQDENQTDTPIEMMLDYGSTVSKEFAKSYLMKKRFGEAHDSGDIHIHDLNFMPIGTTTCCQIDLAKLYNEGFQAGNIYIREPKDIMSYSALAVIAINLNQKEQHGCQSIATFDYDMAQGVVRTFKKQFKQTIYDILDYTDFDKFAAVNGIDREIDRIESIEFDIGIFDKYCRESEQLKRMFQIAYTNTKEKIENLVYQAMEAFIHNVNVLNTKNNKEDSYPSINFGTDTTPEGRLIIKSLLHVIDVGLGMNETPQSPILIFKIKEGVNFNKKDINYDLFLRAIEIASKRNFPHFAFLDAPFNLKFYEEKKKETEVAYNTRNIRVMENIVDKDKAITTGRGNLSYTTINLPRLGIKHGIQMRNKEYLEEFFTELEEKIELAKDQLLERFEVQTNKHASCFSFLIEQGVWIEGEKLKEEDKIRKVLKHGTMSIGVLGLAECLKALTGYHQAESKNSQELGIKIIQFITDKLAEYSKKHGLNFSLLGINDKEIAQRFITLDRAIYGKIDKITSLDQYTDSFCVPTHTKISTENRIKLEAPYHMLTDGGHCITIELKEEKNITSEMEKVLREMKEAGIGYAKIVKK